MRVEDVGCVKCGAGQTEPCTGPSGWRRATWHRARLIASMVVERLGKCEECGAEAATCCRDDDDRPAETCEGRVRL